MNNYLITIVGPTAIGKTSLSIALAKEFGCDIVSCDSRQFYKELTIGTAVPSKEELLSATHHFIQNRSVLEEYTVGSYEKEAVALLEDLFKKNNIQILVGGSGLYFDAIINGLDFFPEVKPDIRNLLKENFDKFGIAYLQETFFEKDKDYYLKIKEENPQTLLNPQRLMRFLEVCLSAEKPYSSFLNKEKRKRNFTSILIGLDAKREIIYSRINQRVDKMMNAGLLLETMGVYPYKNSNALNTVGYRELFEYLEGNCELDFAIEEIKKNTRRFSKRQLTWFKRYEKITWFDYNTKSSEIVEFVKNSMSI